MRVQTLFALCAVFAAIPACSTHELMAPTGTGNKAEIPANVQQMIPENAFPLAKRFADNCADKQDLASCNYLAWMLSEGMAVPPDHADETDARKREGSPFVPEQPRYAAVEKNAENSALLYKAACDGGFKGACVSLQQAGKIENPAAVLTEACSLGSSRACEGLAGIIEAGGIAGISNDQIRKELESSCNRGYGHACTALAQVSDRFGKASEALPSDPRLLTIRKGSSSVTVSVYTDNQADADGIANRAKDAFGSDVAVRVRAGEASNIASEWLDTVPELLALVQGLPQSATLKFTRDSISLNSHVQDAALKASLESALARLAGEDRSVKANFDAPAVEESEEEAN